MSRSVLVGVVAALAAATVLAAPAEDLVTSLPLFNGTFPSKHYSGYLKGLNGSHLHYYLVVAAEVDPTTAPFVVWTNGGPGCSSMDGWGYELGPFHFKNYGTAGPVFELNPYTWTKNATIAFIENPPGVGFSYRDDGNYTITDSMNAENNYAAILDLLHNKFPEYANNTFYVSGESYGGIYVPTIANQILLHGGIPNFAGIIVGNGYTSETYDANFYWGDAVFANGHGFMTDSQLAIVKTACVPPEGNPNGAACVDLQNDFYTNMAPYVNSYDYTATCFQPPKLSDLYVPAARRRLTALARSRGMSVVDYIVSFSNSSFVPTSPPSIPQVPCIDGASMTTYLNRADVKEALHVEPSLTWSLCYSIDYISNIPDVVFVYKALLKAGKRVLIYNGNLDMSTPYPGTRAWIEHETDWKVTRDLQGWSFSDAAYLWGPQQGGFAVEYEGKLWFTLVNGAGHMVPQFRPPAAQAMFLRFIGHTGF